MTNRIPKIVGLPGSEKIALGIIDHAEGKVSINSLLIEIARPLLIRGGIATKGHLNFPDQDAEHALYRILSDELGGAAAYTRYNALLRELTSFARALTIHNRAASVPRA